MLTGIRFGRLIAIEKIKVKYITKYKCTCDCGNEVIIDHGSLQSGRTKSCGCLNKEKASENAYKHGHSGYNESKEYRTWCNMKIRCYNKNHNRFEHYGGKGIKVCDRWLNSFENFLADMGNAPSSEYSIDRINNDGDYDPNNCRWATASEQINNSSNKNSVII